MTTLRETARALLEAAVLVAFLFGAITVLYSTVEPSPAQTLVEQSK